MKVDHVGIAVKNLERAIQEFETLGYQFGEKIEDTARNVLICFGENGSYRVELVQALDKMRASPIDGILKKTGGGATPYHICYVSDNLEQDMMDLCNNGFLPILQPCEAVALQGRRVSFLVSVGAGLIELVEGSR